MSTNAHITTQSDTKMEKYRTIVLAVKTEEFKEYH
jgi:hypothetical protein